MFRITAIFLSAIGMCGQEYVIEARWLEYVGKCAWPRMSLGCVGENVGEQECVWIKIRSACGKGTMILLLQLMHIPIVRKAHLHVKHAKTRRSECYVTPRKIGLSKIEF